MGALNWIPVVAITAVGDGGLVAKLRLMITHTHTHTHTHTPQEDRKRFPIYTTKLSGENTVGSKAGPRCLQEHGKGAGCQSVLVCWMCCNKAPQTEWLFFFFFFLFTLFFFLILFYF